MAQVWKMDWTERERGFGQRPDGCSLHATQAEWARFIAEVRSRMPREAPDEYEAPDRDEPELCECSEGLASLVGESGSLRLGRGMVGLSGGVLEARHAGLAWDGHAALARAEAERIGREAGGAAKAGARPGL